MRIGIAGVGRIGAFHAATLRNVPGVDTLVLADADAARAAQVAGELGVEHVENTDALLKSGIDGFVIASATETHAELLVAGVKAGIATFCEKPVAPTAAGTLEVLNAVRESDVPVQIGFQRRFDAGFVAARAAVDSGELGWVHTMRAGTLDMAPPPPSYVPGSGGIFRDCSVHDFDIIRFVSGAEVEEVYALGTNRGEDFIREADDVDTIGALLTMNDGTITHVMASRYNQRGYDVRLEVLGSKDSISVGLDAKLPLRSVEPSVTFPDDAPYQMFLDRFTPAYVAELAAFVDVAARKIPSPCTVADALEAFLIAEACDLSRREHRPVKISEVR